MAFANLVKIAVSGTPGTGTITLGSAVSPYFGTGELVDGTSYSYSILDGSNVCSGRGTYTASGTTLTRDAAERCNVGGTPQSTPMSLSSAAVVSITALALDLPINLSIPSFVGGVLSGKYYTSSRGTNNSSTNARTMVADDLTLSHFIPAMDLPINQIAVVTGSTANGNVKHLIYDSDANGWPSALLFESSSVASTSTNSSIASTVAQTFRKGKLYWLGVRTSGTPILQSFNAGGSWPFFVFSSTSPGTILCMIQRTLAFATAAPNPFTFVAADASNFNPICAMVKAA